VVNNGFCYKVSLRLAGRELRFFAFHFLHSAYLLISSASRRDALIACSLYDVTNRPVDVPEFPLNALRRHVIEQLEDAVMSCKMNFNEATGRSQETLFV